MSGASRRPLPTVVVESQRLRSWVVLRPEGPVVVEVAERSKRVPCRTAGCGEDDCATVELEEFVTVAGCQVTPGIDRDHATRVAVAIVLCLLDGEGVPRVDVDAFVEDMGGGGALERAPASLAEALVLRSELRGKL